MRTTRLDILFSGPAPTDERERAQLLAGPKIDEALTSVARAFEAAGWPMKLTTKSIMENPKLKAGARPALVEAAE